MIFDFCRHLYFQRVQSVICMEFYVNFVNQDSDSVSIFAQELRTEMFATDLEQN